VIGLMVPALAFAAYVWIAQYLRLFQPAAAEGRGVEGRGPRRDLRRHHAA